MSGCEPTINGVPAGTATIQALDWKNSVRVATTAATAAATLSGNVLTANANGALPAIDGIALVVGDSILLKDQAGGDQLENGIYLVSDLGSAGTPWVLTRRVDADSSADVTTGMTCRVEEGTINAGTIWALTTVMPIVLNTTALVFSDVLKTIQLLVDRGTDAMGVAGAKQIVIGDGVGDAGITIFTGVAETGRLDFTDVSATLVGSIQYSHANGDLRIFIQGNATPEAILSASAFFPGASGGNAIGQPTNFWAKSYINTVVYSVQTIGDGATAGIGASKIINVTAPTAASTLTLPTAVVGDHYFIDVVNATATVILDAAAGDTINGGVVAGNATLVTAGWYHLYAHTTTDWRLHGPLALGPASA